MSVISLGLPPGSFSPLETAIRCMLSVFTESSLSAATLVQDSQVSNEKCQQRRDEGQHKPYKNVHTFVDCIKLDTVYRITGEKAMGSTLHRPGIP